MAVPTRTAGGADHAEVGSRRDGTATTPVAVRGCATGGCGPSSPPCSSIPSVAFLALAGVQTASLVGQTDGAQRVRRRGRHRPADHALVHQLQQERDRTAGELAELRGRRRARPATPRSPRCGRFRAATDGARRAPRGRRTAGRARHVLAGRVRPGRWRRSTRSSTAGRGPPARPAARRSSSNYRRMIEPCSSCWPSRRPAATRPALTEAVLRYVQLARVKEIWLADPRAALAAARAGRLRRPTTWSMLSDLRAQRLGRARRLPGRRATGDRPPLRRRRVDAGVRAGRPGWRRPPAQRCRPRCCSPAVVDRQPAAAGAAAPAESGCSTTR